MNLNPVCTQSGVLVDIELAEVLLPPKTLWCGCEEQHQLVLLSVVVSEGRRAALQ